MKKKTWSSFLIVAIVAVLLLGFLFALGNLSRGYAREGRQQLEEALRKAAVACYAAEGIYPPTLDYLVQHYGVQIDEERYTVYYEVFAENLMPEIIVLEKGS